METQGASRVRIRLFVSLLPGVHLRELQRLLGMSFNSTRYHVERLAKTGEIVRVEDGGYSRLYPAGISDEERVLFSLVRGETDRRILAPLARERELSNKKLRELTGLAKSTISEHLGNLVQLGIVRIRPTRDTGTVYELENPEQILRLMRNQDPTLLKKATNRFIDLWDF